MSFIDLFPSVISLNTLPDIPDKDIKSWEQFIKSSKVVNEGQNGMFTQNQNLLNGEIFDKLRYKILNISRSYLNELGHIFEDIQIASSWGNILPPNTKINTHTHSNAYICGVFYLNHSSPIFFNNPLLKKWQFRTSINSNGNHHRKQINYKITPKPKSILIFPSWLEHSVPNSLNSERISIAFNIIPKGEFGEPTRKLYL